MGGRRLPIGSGLLLLALVVGGLAFRPRGVEAATASPEFMVAPFATGLRGPTALAIGPGGPFGERLYVLDRDPGTGTGRLVAVDPAGQAIPVVENLQQATGLVFSTGGAWESFGYVLEGLGDKNSSLRVVRVSPLGTAEHVAAVPGGARVPGGVVLSPAGAWGEALYLSDAGEGEVLRVSPAGQASVFLKGLSGPRAMAWAPAGSPFGEGLYVIAGRALLRVSPDGQPRPVLENLQAPGGVAFGVGDAMGLDLYLCEGGLAGGRLLRISPSGGVSVVAEGFGTISAIALAPAGPLGPALYVADGVTGTIYRIVLASP